MQTTLSLFPFAKHTSDNIEQQNRFLKKISLTGKINALDFSANLFNYTDETIEKFESLKVELVEALVEENLNKVNGELALKAQLSIDVLKRNLFERTADVGFLATDGEIIAFLEDTHCSKEKIVARLQEYVKKYSVYDDVILFDTEGNARVNINSGNKVTASRDTILEEALQSDTFVEYYRHSDIFDKKEKSLLYAHKIVSDRRTIGVLCLSFKFDDELRTIFETLADQNVILSLEDESGVIASSDTKAVPLKKRVTLRKHHNFSLYNQKYFAVKAETTGYQGYFGLDWKAIAIYRETRKENTTDDTPAITLPPKLDSIIQRAREIVEDLGDVIINGELIASKFRQYSLSPILENLRQISAVMLQNINESATNLVTLNREALMNNAKIATSFSMDLMDRNLYERANDCRWWALTPQFIAELAKSEPDQKILNDILLEINTLYTVYTNLFLYDKSGTIVAASRDHTVIGTKISSQAVTQTLQNIDSQRYFVSPFEETPLYGNRPTYIYHASVVNGKENIGGIGIVFDSEPEFRAILQDSALQHYESFSLFCDQNQNVISSTHPKIQVQEKLSAGIPLRAFDEEKIFQDFIDFEERRYLLTVVPSHGYREYKRKDNYRNKVFALSFVAV